MPKYCYPAVLSPDGGSYLVTFPDLPSCFTSGENLIEALEMGEDALSLMLVGLEDGRMVIPPPSAADAVERETGDIVTYVLADTAAYRKRVSNTAVKKTLSIPQWLNTAAEAANVNFSQTLQDALAAKLGLS